MEPETYLEELYKARSAILAGGQSYAINSGGASRQITAANLAEINKEIIRLENQIASQSGGAGLSAGPGW
ncbi:MAG: hypothetical protein LBJ31_11865 [Treponema sp.]|jgi:hypothetical protein|nr:hypothetical protein [Treponema sp.]